MLLLRGWLCCLCRIVRAWNRWHGWNGWRRRFIRRAWGSTTTPPTWSCWLVRLGRRPSAASASADWPFRRGRPWRTWRIRNGRGIIWGRRWLFFWCFWRRLGNGFLGASDQIGKCCEHRIHVDVVVSFLFLPSEDWLGGHNDWSGSFGRCCKGLDMLRRKGHCSGQLFRLLCGYCQAWRWRWYWRWPWCWRGGL